MKLFKTSMVVFLLSTSFLSSFESNAYLIQSVDVYDEIQKLPGKMNVAIPDDTLQAPYLHEINNTEISEFPGNIKTYVLPEFIQEHIQVYGPLSAVLFQDGVLLNKLNNYHDLIDSEGEGRTNFCENGILYFSTSDNSPIEGKKFVISLSAPECDKVNVQLHDEIKNTDIPYQYLLPRDINNRFKIDLTQVQPFGVHGYSYVLPDHIYQLINDKGIYEVALVENDTILNKVNSYHGIIQDQGMGAVSFCENGTLYFSTSDNSPLDNKNYYIVLGKPALARVPNEQLIDRVATMLATIQATQQKVVIGIEEVNSAEREEQKRIEVLIDEISELLLSNLIDDAVRTMKAAQLGEDLVAQVMAGVQQRVNDWGKIGQFMAQYMKPDSPQNSFTPPPPPPPALMGQQADPKPQGKKKDIFLGALPPEDKRLDQAQLLAALEKRKNIEGNDAVEEHESVAEENAKIEAEVEHLRGLFENDRKDVRTLELKAQKARLETFRDQNYERFKRIVATTPTDPFVAEYIKIKIQIHALNRLLAE